MARDHFVPQVYLKSFLRRADGFRNPVLWIYDKGRSGCHHSSTKDIAHRFGYYPPDLDDALTEVEKAIGPV